MYAFELTCMCTLCTFLILKAYSYCKNSIQKAVTSVTLINTESHHSGWDL